MCSERFTRSTFLDCPSLLHMNTALRFVHCFISCVTMKANHCAHRSALSRISGGGAARAQTLARQAAR